MNRRDSRRGVQMVEMMIVLPIVGMVLTAVALSVAGTQRTLQKVQQQGVELATVDRLAQQLREDVHRAITLPKVAGQVLEIERADGAVRYHYESHQLVRRFESGDGSSRAPFDIPVGDAPWTILPEEGLFHFAWYGDGDEGKQIVVAWPGNRSEGENGGENGGENRSEAAAESADGRGEEAP